MMSYKEALIAMIEEMENVDFLFKIREGAM